MGSLRITGLLLVIFLLCQCTGITDYRPSEGSGGEEIAGYIFDPDKIAAIANDNGLTVKGDAGAAFAKRICLAQAEDGVVERYRNFVNNSLGAFFSFEREFWLGSIEVNPDGSFEQNWPRLAVERYVTATGDGERTLMAYLPESADPADDLTCDETFGIYHPDEFPTAGYLRTRGDVLLTQPGNELLLAFKRLFN